MLVAVLLIGLCAPGARAADFGTTNFDTSFSSAQAGASADYTLKFGITREDPSDPMSPPSGVIRDQVVDLPPGFIADPTAADACSMAGITYLAIQRCPATSVVGTARLRLFNSVGGSVMPMAYLVRVYRLKPYPGEAAAFGFAPLLAYTVRLSVTVDPSNGYRIRVSSHNQQAGAALVDAEITMWGVPAEHQGPGPLNELAYPQSFGGPMPASVRRQRFASVPTRCDQPAVTSMTLASWQDRVFLPPVLSSAGTPSGCENLVFSPALEVTPTVTQAAVPSGYRVVLGLGQSSDPARPRTPNLKDATVTLPQGVAISPSAANGLTACTDAQFGVHSAADATCPASSKIGDVRIDSPVLDEPVLGSVFTGEQLSNDPTSGKMFRIFLVATASGVNIKLPGQIALDPGTGQITARFLDNPDLPFEKLTLTFKDGARAPLTTPPTCGEHDTHSTFASWAGQSVDLVSPFQIACAPGAGSFDPSFSAGTVTPVAGAFSPLVMSFSRPDGQQELGSINGSLPAGLLGYLKSVPLCSAAQGAAGTCPAASRVGKVQIAAGIGPDPVWLPYGGHGEDSVYLTEPYRKGDVAGMSIVVPAVAGPFDLGTVVTKVYLKLRPKDQGIDMQSEQLPRIVGGVPVQIRKVVVTIDRKGFIVNPTSCREMATYANVFSQSWTKAPRAARFQVGDCASLPFSPIMQVSGGGKGDTKRYEHPSLKVTIRQPAGQSNLDKANVVLPKELNIDLKAPALKAACPRDVYAQDTCSPVATVGTVEAVTPLLREPLTGPAFLIQKKGKLPDLVMRLRNNRMSLDLIGVLDFLKDGRLITRVKGIPDAALSSFVLNIKGGKDGSLLNRSDLCAHRRLTKATFKGQNGKLSRKSPVTRISGCASKASTSRAASRRAVRSAAARASAARGAHAAAVHQRAAGGRS